MTRICADDTCDRPNYGYGLCKLHYRRALAGKYPMPHKPSRSERFWSRVTKTDTCWLWPGHSTSHGYGQFGRPIVLAHRFAYEDTVGPIPEGLVLDHLCRVRNCVNPAHLEPVTQAENNRRARASITHCPQGHPYDEANTYTPPSRNDRMCRACMAQRSRARNAARRKSVASTRGVLAAQAHVAAHEAARSHIP